MFKKTGYSRTCSTQVNSPTMYLDTTGVTVHRVTLTFSFVHEFHCMLLEGAAF